MNGHTVGPRAAWLLAATALALSTSLGVGPAPTSAGLAPSHVRVVSLGSAVEDPGVLNDLFLDQGGTSQELDTPRTPEAAFAADAFSWPRSGPTVVSTSTTPAAPTGIWWHRYHGTNHVWMPTLGLSKAVYLFPCSRSTDPANYVYRWGCAGHNNVYLLGHNFGVFHPLYLAYYNHTLKKGMPVVYADGSGRVRLYRVTSWRVVDPTDSGWAIASQPVPSMTLQTCVGKNGSLRLNVRLVAVNR
jgi:sortase family protein